MNRQKLSARQEPQTTNVGNKTVTMYTIDCLDEKLNRLNDKQNKINKTDNFCHDIGSRPSFLECPFLNMDIDHGEGHRLPRAFLCIFN